MLKIGKFTKCLLSADMDYWGMSTKEIKKKYNGIGPESFLINLLPRFLRNSVWLADFGEIGYIHDHRYSNKPEVVNNDHYLADYKRLADKELLNNGIRIAKYYKKNPGWFVRCFVSTNWLYNQRLRRLNIYYDLCCKHGDEYFKTGNKAKLKKEK